MLQINLGHLRSKLHFKIYYNKKTAILNWNHIAVYCIFDQLKACFSFKFWVKFDLGSFNETK